MYVTIVEDDPGVCDSLQFLLQAMGFLVRTFADAESFLEYGAPEPGDVVIVDLGLPGLSGAEAIRWLQSLDAPPRVICISGQAQKIIDENLRDISLPCVLRKPLNGDKLMSLLSRATH